MATTHAEFGLQLASARNHVTAPYKATRVVRRTAPVPAASKPEPSPSATQHALIVGGRLRTSPRPSWLASAIAVAAVAGLTWWIMAQRAPAIDPRNLIATNLSAAQQAIRAGRYLDPPERSAVHYYSTVLALDPANTEAASGIDRIADVFLANAKAFIVDGRIAEAVIALEDVRRLRPAHRRLPLVEAQLRREMDNQVFLQSSEREAAPPQQAARRREASSSAGAAPRAGANSEIDTVARMTAARRDAPASPVPPAAELGNATNSGAQEALAAAIVPLPQDTSSASANASGSVDAPSREAATTSAALIAPPVLAVTTEGAADEDAAGSSLAPAENTPAAAPPTQRTLVKYVAPEYPREALLRGIEGWIDMSLQVTPGGDVVDPRVSDGKGRQLFDRAALAAVRQWKYEPRSAQDAPQRIEVRVTFKLED
jgi:TonB family protein